MKKTSSSKPELKKLWEIQERANKEVSDISEHLVPLFIEALQSRPKLIVELGVRGGESTFVLERVATLCDSKLISVDIEPTLHRSSFVGWQFIQKDDQLLAAEFPDFCEKNALPPKIDVLFLDTSHHYDHTVNEIRLWFPLLSERAKVILHDTNMKEIYKRKDGTVAFGWDNHRGVIRAVEEYFGTKFEEDVDFIDFRKGWLIRHISTSSGFTVLEKFNDLKGVL